MSDAKTIWATHADEEVGDSFAAPNIHFTPLTGLGRLLLHSARHRLYNYAIEDAPKTAWLKQALEGSGPRALDVGVRTGAGARFLKANGKHVYGIDIADRYIEYCKAHQFIENGWVCNIEAETIPGGPYDVILLSEVIEHILDGQSALKRLASALKPGGLLLITTPNLAFMLNRLRLLCGRDLDVLTMDRGVEGNQHIRVFTARLLKKLCSEAGLDVDNISGDGLPLSLGKHIKSSGSSYPVMITIGGTLFPTFSRTLYVRARRQNPTD